MGKVKFGLIGVGQSPRIDNRSFVHNWFKAQGLDVEIYERGIFDGMSFEELRALEGPYDPDAKLYSPDTRSGGFVHAPGMHDDNLGDDWFEVWLPQTEVRPRIQKTIDKLEEDGVDLMMLCCGKIYPPHAFHSHVPVILPYRATQSYVRMLAETMDHPRVGVAIGLGRTYWRDVEYWTSNEWAHNVDFTFGVGNGNKEIDDAAKGNLDLLVFVGYHCLDYRDGKLGPQENYSTRLEKEFGCPVVTSASASLLFARALMMPAINEKELFVPLIEE